jgi:hypothetical protein
MEKNELIHSNLFEPFPHVWFNGAKVNVIFTNDFVTNHGVIVFQQKIPHSKNSSCLNN